MARVPAVGEDHALPGSSGVCAPLVSWVGFSDCDAELGDVVLLLLRGGGGGGGGGCDGRGSFSGDVAHLASSTFSAAPVLVWFGRLATVAVVGVAEEAEVEVDLVVVGVASGRQRDVSGPAGSPHLCCWTSSCVWLSASGCCCCCGRFDGSSRSTGPFVVPQCLQGLSVHKLHGAPILSDATTPTGLTSAALWRSDVALQVLSAVDEGSAATGPSWRERGFVSSDADDTTGLTSASSVCVEFQRGWAFLADKCFRMLHWREMTPWSH